MGLVKKSIREHRQYRITSKARDVVILSEGDYESLLETLELLSTPAMLKSLRQAKNDREEGETYSMEEVFGE